MSFISIPRTFRSGYTNDQEKEMIDHNSEKTTLNYEQLNKRTEPLKNNLLFLRVTAPMNANFASNFCNLTALKLENCKKITDRKLYFLANLIHLEKLGIISSVISDAGLTSLTNLIKPNELFFNCNQFTDKGIAFLTRFTKLSSLQLNCPKITYRGILSLLPLEKLSQVAFSSDSFKYSLSNFQDLKPTPPLIKELSKKPFCNIVDLSYLKEVNDQVLKYLPLFNYSKIYLQGTCITDIGLEHLAKFGNIASLNLRDCSKITDTGIELFLKTINSINELEATTSLPIKQYIKIKLEKLAVIENLVNATIEAISPHLNYEDLKETATVNKKLNEWYKFERIRRLNNGTIKLSALTIRNFKNIINDNFLVLSRLKCPASTTEEIKDFNFLTNLKNLMHLDFENYKGSAITFTQLQLLTKLSSLSLRCCAIEKIADFTHIKFLTKLSHLDLHQASKLENVGLKHLTNLTYLDLSNTWASEEELSSLAHLTNLTHLDIARTFIANKGLDSITNLTNLTHLNLALGWHESSLDCIKLAPLKNLVHLNLMMVSCPGASNITNLVLQLLNLKEVILDPVDFYLPTWRVEKMRETKIV